MRVNCTVLAEDIKEKERKEKPRSKAKEARAKDLEVNHNFKASATTVENWDTKDGNADRAPKEEKRQ